MPSIGELFVSLGFDVDDQKLKAFKDTLKGAHEEMIKLGAVATATVGTLTLFVERASEGAVRLNNMATLMGVNTQAAQTFANALHQVNAAISLPEAQQKWSQFSNFINAAIVQGKGGEGAGALARLGVQWSENLTPESAIEQMRTNLPLILKTLSNDPVRQLAIQADLLNSIPGLSGTGNLLRMSSQQYQAAGRYNVQQSTLDSLTRFASATAELDEAFHKFSTDMAGELAPKLTKAIHWLVDALNYVDNFNAKHPGAATAEALGVGAAGTVGASWGIGKIARWLGLATGTGAAGGAGLGTLGVALLGSAPWLGSWAGEEIAGAINRSRLSSQLSPGVMRRLQLESAMNPSAVGDSGAAYGIAQWHSDRQAMFARVMGHDIHGSTLEEQEQFVNWELMHGDAGARKAGQLMSQTKDEDERYRIFTKYFERPAGAEKIEINVHAKTDDPNELGQIVADHVQGVINRAHAQTNQGGQ